MIKIELKIITIISISSSNTIEWYYNIINANYIN